MRALGSPGSYTVYIAITDNVGFTAESNIASVTVYLSPSVSVSTGSIIIDDGEPQLSAHALRQDWVSEWKSLE